MKCVALCSATVIMNTVPVGVRKIPEPCLPGAVTCRVYPNRATLHRGINGSEWTIPVWNLKIEMMWSPAVIPGGAVAGTVPKPAHRMNDDIHIMLDHPIYGSSQIARGDGTSDVVCGVRGYVEHCFSYRRSVSFITVFAMRKIKGIDTHIEIASCFHGYGQLGSCQVAETAESSTAPIARVDHADLDALASVSGIMPFSRAVYRHGIAGRDALRTLRRKDLANADYAFLFRRFRKQRYRHVGFYIADSDVSWRSAIVLEVSDYGLHIAFYNMQGCRDGLLLMQTRASRCGPSSELAAFNPLDDVIEI